MHHTLVIGLDVWVTNTKSDENMIAGGVTENIYSELNLLEQNLHINQKTRKLCNNIKPLKSTSNACA